MVCVVCPPGDQLYVIPEYPASNKTESPWQKKTLPRFIVIVEP